MEGRVKSVTIPAYNNNSIPTVNMCNSEGYCGFEYLTEVLVTGRLRPLNMQSLSVPETASVAQNAANAASISSVASTNENGLISLDYKNHILTADMTTTHAQTYLTDTIKRFQRDGMETVVIRVPNGSFTVAMDDLIQMLGTSPSFSLRVNGDTLVISAGGNEVCALVMN